MQTYVESHWIGTDIQDSKPIRLPRLSPSEVMTMLILPLFRLEMF